VPLSEHEQRLLDQIEQALYAEDPKFASSVRAARAKARTRRWVIVAVLGVLAGLGVILIGLAAKLVFLGVLGFVLIVGACAYAAAMIRGRNSTPDTVAGAAAAPKTRKTGVRSRMEDRLRRRFDEN
jgi:Protein of unknown function (DUF3040)